METVFLLLKSDVEYPEIEIFGKDLGYDISYDKGMEKLYYEWEGVRYQYLKSLTFYTEHLFDTPLVFEFSKLGTEYLIESENPQLAKANLDGLCVKSMFYVSFHTVHLPRLVGLFEKILCRHPGYIDPIGFDFEMETLLDKNDLWRIGDHNSYCDHLKRFLD